MIQKQTILNVADNSGAKKILCIGIPGSNKKTATVGDVITATVKEAAADQEVKEHEIVRAVVVRSKKEVRRKDGSYIRFDDNAAVIVNKNNQPRGTRVFGPVAREVREKGFTRIASLAKEVL